MRYRHGVLALLFFLSVITYVDRVCISVAGPRMQSELGLSPAAWGWVVGVFTLSYALFEIPSGAMADRIGARKVLTRIVLWWSTFTALTGAVSSFPALLLTRFAFGAGEAGAYPGSASSISRWFPSTQRARAASVVWMASRVGGAISPLMVIPIQAAYGWRMSFFLFGIAGLVWCAVWFFWYRDTPELKEGVTAAEIAELDVSEKQAHRVPWRAFSRQKNFWLILIMYHTYCWGAYFYLSWLHTFLARGRGVSDAEMRILAPWPFIAGACGNLTGGALSDALTRRYGLRRGRCIVGATGLALSGIMMLLCAITPGKTSAIVFLSFGYFAMDSMLPVAWAICLDVARNYGGAMSGAMNMAGQLGSFISSLAFGYVVQIYGNYNTPLIVFSFMLMVSAGLFALIHPEKPLTEVREPELVIAPAA